MGIKASKKEILQMVKKSSKYVYIEAIEYKFVYKILIKNIFII